MQEKNRHNWNLFWAIIAGIMLIWNLVSLIFYILEKSWTDIIILVIFSTLIGYIFITSISRLLKEDKHDKDSDIS